MPTRVRVESTLGPVLHSQSVNAGELSGIVRNENHINLQRMATDEGIQGTCWLTHLRK
jgi:hypothetical protein